MRDADPLNPKPDDTAPASPNGEGHALLAVDPHNPRAKDLVARLKPFIDLGRLPSPLCVVVGGDGFMLRTIRELGPAHVYLGLNAGHLGFLLNDVGDAALVAAAIRDHAWTARRFPRLSMTARKEDGSRVSAVAVNDLYLERATGQTAHFQVKIDGEVVVKRLICDGLLTSTALGSTAYSYSAGGVPCHPLVRALQVTPIAPHVPRLTPLVLPLTSVVELVALDTERRPVRAVADGVDLGHVSGMRVADANSDVTLAFFQGHDFTRAMVRKILRT